MRNEENTVEEGGESEEEELETGMNASFALLPGAWPDIDFDLEEDEQESEEALFGRPTRIWCVETLEKVEFPSTFAEEVISELPYVAAASEEQYAFDGVLMDEERVIGARTESSNNISRVDEHYFG